MKKLIMIFSMLCMQYAYAAPLQFQAAVIPESPPGVNVMAAYFNIVNQHKTERLITQVSSPDFETVEIHESIIKNGIAKMQPLKKLSIPANSTVSLKPGGIHLMLINPKKPLRENDAVLLKIIEQDKTEHALVVPVKKVQSQNEHNHHHHE